MYLSVLLQGMKFIVNQIKDDINLCQTCQLIFSLSRWNEELATAIVNTMLHSVVKSSSPFHCQVADHLWGVIRNVVQKISKKCLVNWSKIIPFRLYAMRTLLAVSVLWFLESTPEVLVRGWISWKCRAS